MYTITKHWRDELYIPVINPNGREDVIPLKCLVQPGNLDKDTGKYWRDARCFVVGTEEGKGFWSICPTMGRFEFKVVPKKNILEIYYLPGVPPIEVVPDLESGPYEYDGFLFQSIEDILVYLYLTSPQDYSKKDMTFFAGRRKYGDKLYLL